MARRTGTKSTYERAMAEPDKISPTWKGRKTRVCKDCGEEVPLKNYTWAFYKGRWYPKSRCQECRAKHMKKLNRSRTECRKPGCSNPSGKNGYCPECGRANGRKSMKKNQHLPCSFEGCKNPRAKGQTVCQEHASWKSTKEGRIKLYGEEAWERTKKSKIRANYRYNDKRRPRPNDWTPEDEKFMFQWWNFKCAYCGCDPKAEDTVMVREHFISDGGTVPDNLVAACGSCNASKGPKDPEDWLVETFGEDKATEILDRIEKFFEEVRQV